MSSYLECTFEWLHLRLPHLSALVSGLLLGIFGLASLGLIIWIFAPASLMSWMPLILIFCSANGGYRLMQKREKDSGRPVWFYLVLLAVLLMSLTAAGQIYVDTHLFHAGIRWLPLTILAGCSSLGIWLGFRLRLAYEGLES